MKIWKIDLQNLIDELHGIKFLTVEIPITDHYVPFAHVRYSLNGAIQDSPLRLDMDKEVFLNRFENEYDKLVQTAAPMIVEIIRKMRKTLQSETQAAPGGTPREQELLEALKQKEQQIRNLEKKLHLAAQTQKEKGY